MIHLDTSFLIDALREARRAEPGPALAWLTEQEDERIAVSLFVLCELLLGAELHAQREVERSRVRRTCGGLEVVSPDERLPARYARTHAALTRDGLTVATMDLLIACVALNEDAALVTANERDFSRVPGLRVVTYR
ncbi:MAG: type II toxin-antitoxin system VapC family toxin [Longimicrobiales bacterium]|nr:type II toxin-antitoxin system VapC family toxin [Longimicrobiales bacterium]